MNIHFISGIPRSGSSLFANLLFQNPKFHVTPTSGILDVMLRVRNQWDEIESFRANPDEDAKVRVLKAILHGFHEEAVKEGKVIFDKSRGWLQYIELVEKILNKKIKILVTVRDLRDVLASFEKIYRANSTRQLSQEKQYPVEFRTVEGRCKIWADASQVVGSSYNSIKDALARGFRDRMHFVRYEELTTNPTAVMEKVYEFLSLPKFKHNFTNVVQKLNENDEVGYGIPNLHTIRTVIAPQPSQWKALLGEELGTQYAGLELW